MKTLFSKRHWWVLPAVVALAVGLGVGLVVGKLIHRVPVGIEPGLRAPDFSIPRLDTGDTVALSQFKGKVVLLLFWQSTCPDCRRAMPYFQELLDRFGKEGLVILGVDLDHDPDTAREYLRENGYTLVPLWGSYQEAMRLVDLYQVPLVPHVILIDRKGIIRFRGTYPDVPAPQDIERWLR